MCSQSCTTCRNNDSNIMFGWGVQLSQQHQLTRKPLFHTFCRCSSMTKRQSRRGTEGHEHAWHWATQRMQRRISRWRCPWHRGTRQHNLHSSRCAETCTGVGLGRVLTVEQMVAHGRVLTVVHLVCLAYCKHALIVCTTHVSCFSLTVCADEGSKQRGIQKAL